MGAFVFWILKNKAFFFFPLKSVFFDPSPASVALALKLLGAVPSCSLARIETFLKMSVGLTSMIWAFFLFREPRHGVYHQVETLTVHLA